MRGVALEPTDFAREERGDAGGIDDPAGLLDAFAAGLLLSLGLVYSVRAAWRFAVMAALALWVLVEGAGRVYLGDKADEYPVGTPVVEVLVGTQ